MAEIKYTANRDIPENIQGVEKYSQEDVQLISSFEVNSSFNAAEHYIELHLLSLTDEILFSENNYTGYTQLGNAQSSGQDGASVLTIDPILDSINFDYGNGGVKLLYHFLNDLYSKDQTSVEFYIKDISPDRTELKLNCLTLSSEEILLLTSNIKNRLENEAFFNEFRLNFGDNDILIGLNIDTLEAGIDREVVVKLYEPLPTTYGIKSKLRIVELVADSAAYEIDTVVKPDPTIVPTLRSANFNIELQDENVVPTGYFNYDELFSYPINNSNNQLFSAITEKGIEISVDYSDFGNFVHFSSAEERVINFKYKLDLITSYSSSLEAISTSTTGIQGISGSRTYFEGLIEGVVRNFDHYERFLYYESGSTSWPKENTTKPYVNKVSNTSEAITWYADQIAQARLYDNGNHSSLEYSIPTYLREDANNQNYLTFVHMIGQHFDNLWLYANTVTDKYDADNRLNKGISKDLVGEALKNFGVKLYTSNKSIENLFTSVIGQAYEKGNEQIINYIEGTLAGTGTPIQPTSYDDYQKEVQKRIYHNLPLLLKSKGTERGLRALINCFGIPSDILDIKVYGGRNTGERPFYGDFQYFTSSLDKVRLDHTGSLIPGDTLSQYTSIIKRDNKYTDDLHPIEVGFSPTDNVDAYIISKSLADVNLANFNIDDYIGNPSSLTENSYENLYTVAETVLGNLSQYNVQDFVRIIKFFDNVIFKMVKDFIPARSVADTGIIIKPNLLNRSKAKSVKATVETISGANMDNAFNYTSSIDTAFTEGKHGDTFGANNQYTASYIEVVNTPRGTRLSFSKNKEEAKYNGELLNSTIRLTDGELNRSNTLKKGIPPEVKFSVKFYATPPQNLCTLNSTIESNYIVQPGVPYSLGEIFGEPGLPAPPNTNYYLGTSTGNQIPSTYTFPTPVGNYGVQTIYANAGPIQNVPCTETITFNIVTCSLGPITAPSYIIQGAQYDLSNWFTLNTNTNVKFEIRKGTELVDTISSAPYTYTFQGLQNDIFNVKVIDNIDNNCKKSTNVEFFTCFIQPAENTEIEFAAQTINTTVIIDVPSLFTGELSTARYYYQVVSPNQGNSVTPNPALWTVINGPEFFEMRGKVNWIKLVNVAETCERVVKVSKRLATAELRALVVNSGGSVLTACSLAGANGGNYQGTPKTLYYTGYSDEEPFDLLQLWNSNRKVYTNSQNTTLANGWYAWGGYALPYSNGYPNPTALSQVATYFGLPSNTLPLTCNAVGGSDSNIDTTP